MTDLSLLRDYLRLGRRTKLTRFEADALAAMLSEVERLRAERERYEELRKRCADALYRLREVSLTKFEEAFDRVPPYTDAGIAFHALAKAAGVTLDDQDYPQIARAALSASAPEPKP